MKTAAIKNVIFDLDGTLIDSSEGVIAATNYALEKFGQPPRTKAEICRFIGYPLEDMFVSFCSLPLDDLKQAFQEKAAGTVVAAAHALPDSDDVVKELHRRGYRLAVATTKFSHHTAGIMEKCGWSKYIGVTASGDEVARVKPAPDVILLALSRLGAKPGETMMIGDTPNDIQASREAGINIAAVRSPYGDDNIRALHPDFYFEHLSDALSILKGI